MKKNIITFITFSLITILPFFSTAQIKNKGLPFIQNYYMGDYNAQSQNWGSIMDSRGILFVANNSGLLQYDGEEWETIEIPNKEVVRGLAINKEGMLFYGAKQDFGYALPDKKGRLYCKSLKHLLPEKYKDFLNIWRVACLGDSVLFQGREYLFSLYKGKLTVFLPKVSFSSMYKVNNRIFLIAGREGILELKGDSLYSFIELEKFGERNYARGIAPYSKDSMLILCSKGVFLSDDNNIVEWDTQMSEFIRNETVRDIKKIGEGYYAIWTRGSGFTIFDKSGKAVQTFNTDNGLIDNLIHNISVDNYEDIWVCMNTGICKIEQFNPFSVIDKRLGLAGSSVLHIPGVLEGYLYIGASKGIYKSEWSDYSDPLKVSTRFEPVENATGQTWGSSILNDKLYITSNSTVYEIDNKKLERRIGRIGLWNIWPLRNKKNYFIGGGDKYLFLYKYENDKLEYKTKIKGFKGECRFIKEDIDGKIWSGYNNDTLLRLSLNEEIDSVIQIEKFSSEDGLPEDVGNIPKRVHDKILFSSKKGVYEFNEKTNSFNLNKEIKDAIGTGEIGSVTEGYNNEIWLTKDEEIYRLILNEDGSYTAKSQIFKKVNKLISGISPINENEVLFSTKTGFIHYNTDTDKNYIDTFGIYIRKVECMSEIDSLIFGGTFSDNDSIITKYQNVNTIQEFLYSENNIRFTFAATFINKRINNKYSWYLEGFDKNWSQWAEKNSKEYTNIPEGIYTFKVKALNVFGNESNITSYKFEVLPPWYKTILAFIIYALLSISLVVLIIKVYTRRLKQQNIKLEQIVKERTHEIVLKNTELQKQKEEIVVQNEELIQHREEIISQKESIEQQNIELEKLSIVASETDNAVMIMDAAGNFEWANEGFERIYGCTLDDHMAKTGKNILEASTNPDIIKIIDKCFKTKKSVLYESKAINQTGEITWVQTTLTPILDGYNEIQRLIAIDTDISKIKKVEKEIRFKNQKINDSIRYALTIQDSILPPESELKKYIDSFLIYQPKDIVSGDFYWFTKIDKYMFLAIADCTGHGVPGAFMSMIGNRLLNEIINEKKIFDPKTVLTGMNKNIYKTLRQDLTKNTDGMDVCLCRLETIGDKTIVTFSGAKRPLFYTNNNNKLIILKGDRKSIGGTITKSNVVFTNEEIELAKGNNLYLSTDGFVDQNNKARKCYGRRRLVKVLEEISHKPLIEQKETLENEMKEWQKDEIQRDDIAIWGIKI